MNQILRHLSKVILPLAVLLSVGAGWGWLHVRNQPPPGVVVTPELSAHIGIVFPPNTVLVEDLGEQEAGGGERKSNQEYRVWSFYSPNEIQVPMGPNSAASAKAASEDLDNSVSMLNHSLAGRRIRNPSQAFGSRWQTGKYEFEGTLVRSPQGDYLHVQRILGQW